MTVVHSDLLFHFGLAVFGSLYMCYYISLSLYRFSFYSFLDNVFYEYEIDEYQPSFLDQPVLRLIKRETETEDKESKVPKKSTTESDLANSSNSKANNPALAAPVTNEDRKIFFYFGTFVTQTLKKCCEGISNWYWEMV